MAYDRLNAKQSITDRKDAEPALDDAFKSGRLIEQKIEDNRHKERMRQAELGLFGKLLGGEAAASTTVAFIVVVCGIVGCAGCWITAGFHAPESEFWSKQAERSLALTTTALSYIFGRSQSKWSARLLLYQWS